MEEFILKYWVQFLFGIIVSVLGVMYKILADRLQKRIVEDKAMKEALLAILHDRLFQACNYYIRLGFIPLEDSESILDNIKIIYDAYHALDGNGTGTDRYNRFKALPVRDEEVKGTDQGRRD